MASKKKSSRKKEAQWLKELRRGKWPKVMSTDVDPKIAQAAANVGYVVAAATIRASLPVLAAETYTVLSMFAGAGWVYLNRVGFSRRAVYLGETKDKGPRSFKNHIGRTIDDAVHYQPKTRRAGMAKSLAFVTALGLSTFSISEQGRQAYYEVRGLMTRAMSHFGLNPAKEARIDSMLDFQLDRRIPQNCFKRVHKYKETIDDAADEYDVDPDLIAAVMTVESCGNYKAKSGAGARGLMQFIPGTARGFCKMRVNRSIDERLNPTKIIHCGAKYLAHLRKYHGDEDTGIGAYNGGPGNMNKWIKMSGGTDYWDIPRGVSNGENYNYVPKVRATQKILENPAAHGVDL